MSPKEMLMQELLIAPDSHIRVELWIHGYEPSESISRETLINMLLSVYFE